MALVIAASAACLDERADPEPVAADEELALGRRYVDDAQFRRDVLEASLVNPDNGYSQLRLERYTEDKWGALPVWKPDLAPTPQWTRPALIAAGRAAFFEYPIQIAAALRLTFDDPDADAKYGTGTVIWTEIPDGDETAFACATCHARPGADGELRAGVTNARFDYGAMLDDFYVRHTPTGDWGPGRADVTPDSVENPAAITDLRPLRLQHRLHKTASVENGLIELAVRTETLILTNLGQAVRPPREIAFALALFLRSLADDLPVPISAGPGRDLFDRHCARCHAGQAMAGPAIPFEEVGTDPVVGQSPDRTTGRYRVPSLRGVGDRRPLLANGAVPDLKTLLDPDRSAPGHRFGLDLSDPDRVALLDFLAAL